MEKNGVNVIWKCKWNAYKSSISSCKFPVLTRKYNSDHRKHKYQLVDEQEKQTTDCFCMKV